MSDYTIKDVYTEYLSGSVMISPPANNIEFVAGSAGGGPLLQKISISDKETAQDLFKGGDLLKALCERLDAGSQVIYAARIAGDSKAKAAATAQATGTDVIRFEGGYFGAWWNGLEIDISGTGADRTVEIIDPDTDQIYSFTAATVQDLVDAVNAGQTLVQAVKLADTLPDAVSLTLTGGDDGAVLSNGDYIEASTYSKDFPEVNWVHFVGADSSGLWTAILTDCQAMISSGAGERWAVLDLPDFAPADYENPTTTEIADYLSTIKDLVQLTKDRNAVFVAGSGKFIDWEGVEYYGRLTSTLSGQLASLPISQSLLGQSPVNLVGLSPRWSRGNQIELVTSNLIHMRQQPGVGFIFALSANNAPSGDAYNRVEKLRAVYSAGKQVRAAAVPHLGRPNDSAGEGLKVLEEDLKKPLELMLQAGDIDIYDLKVESTPEMREVGQAKVILQVNSMKAFEVIIQKVYLS